MPLILLLLFPALEIYLFIKVGAEIGAWAVIVWLAVAIFLGVNILRFLGATAMLEAARNIRSGAAPVQTLADALVKAVAAVLLIIPGFASDVIAILLFVPMLRHFMLKRWLSRFTMPTSFGAKGFGADEQHFGGNVYDHEGAAKSTTNVIEGQVLERKIKDE